MTMTPINAGSILAVDDTPASLRLVTDLLTAEGYEVRAAINGELALHAALNAPPELLLLDICMPGLSGFEVCRQLKAQPHTRDIPVIFVSAMSDTSEILQGFNVGAVDYLTKPYRREELLARVHTHLELYRLRQNLAREVEARTRSLRESESKLRASLLDTISVLAATVELRDPYTAGHQQRVARLAVLIARELGLEEERIEGLSLAGVVHDVGKIKIPAEILSKPGRLSSIEFALIKEHPEIGFDILKAVDFPWPIAQFVLQHHEREDGSGYPHGLTAGAIHLEARILAVADVIEAMASHRPYRPGLGLEAALAEIKAGSGRLFAPEVVDAATRVIQANGLPF